MKWSALEQHLMLVRTQNGEERVDGGFPAKLIEWQKEVYIVMIKGGKK